MGLIRLVLILLLVWLVWRLISTTTRALRRDNNPSPDQIGRMVRCEHCQVHVPEEEAIHEQGRPFCSEEHRHAWLDQQD